MGRGRTAADVQALAVLAGFCLFLGGSAFGKIDFPAPRKREPAKKSEAPAKTNDVKKADEEKKPETIKPYNKVITKEAKSERGLFMVHRVDDKFYFEIPTNEFGKEFLWVTQIERTQAGFGYGGSPVGNRVVRWELRDKDVLLRDVKYTIRAESSDSIRHSVEATSLEPIIRKIPVAAWGTNKAAVIEVTDLFTSDVPEFSAKTRLNASGGGQGALVYRAGQDLPGQHRNQGADHLHPGRASRCRRESADRSQPP
jgi:hypothetical protein